MARKRAAGTTGYAVALIIFVILFVFSLVLAVLFYTQVGAAQAEAKKSNDAVTRLAKRDQQSRLEQEMANRPLPGEAADTLVGYLQKDLSDLKEKIINNSAATTDSIKSGIKQLDLKQPSLIREVEALRATVQDADKRVKAFEKAAADADARAKSAEREKAAIAANYKQSLDAVQGQLNGMKSDFTAYQATVDQQRKTIEQQLNDARTGSEGRVKKLEADVASRDKEITALKDRIASFEKDRGHDPDKPTVDNSTNPDGSIISVRSEQGVVYIDRGLKQHVTPGLTFEVFDKTGVTRDAAGVIRGKATIEVTNVSPDSATARVVREARNATVTEGDIIVNAVYDPNTRFKFVVFGEFDIDNTGQSSVADRRRIETLITRFNGILADELTYDTDFLVLGQEPKVPDPLPKDEMDPTKIAQFEAMTRRYNEYKRLQDAAKALSIPILNQNRFLNLVGYYHR